MVLVFMACSLYANKTNANTLITNASVRLYYQQTETIIKGKVTDAKGEVLPGVTVKLTGPTTQTQITDVNGAYTFTKVLAGNYTLTFSYIGFAALSKSISVSNGTENLQNVVLTEESNKLNEVLVIGYGTVRKSDLTGSVARVSADDVNATPIVALDRALQGRVSGVNVTTNSGRPGGGTTIRIRGTGSVTSSNNPLYVVDGFPVTEINSINPSDIESIDILKDASSTAIYGSRGNNGVVIVTTKRGKTGKVQLAYDGYYGTQKAIRKIPLLNGQQFAEMVNEARVNSGSAIYFDGSAPDRPVPANAGVGTNWQNEVLQNAPIQNHQLTASGGSETMHYAISGGYYNQEGIIKRSGFKRYSLRANVDGTIKPWLKTGLNLVTSYSTGNNARTEVDGNAGGGVISSALSYSPTFPVYNPSGTYYVNLGVVNGLLVDNPVALVNELTDINKNIRILGNAFLEFKIMEGLTFKTTLGGDVSTLKSNNYATRLSQQGLSSNGIAAVSNNEVLSWLNENTLSYIKTFNKKHAFNAVIGFTSQAWERENVTANARTFNTDFPLYNNLGAGSALVAPSSGASETSLLSYLARVNYTFDNKYLFTFSGRADGSSRFAPNNKYGYFPSGAFAWRVSEETFMKKQSIVSDAKLRASYGLGGNQEIGEYVYIPSLTNNTYVLNNTVYTGTTNGSLQNNNLSWEESKQFDLGVDVGFLNNKLRFTVDYYYKKTSDLLFSVGLPAISGYTSSTQNIGNIENRGLEIEVVANLGNKTFGWESQLTYSLNRNKVLKLNNNNEIFTGSDVRLYGSALNPILLRVGDPLGQFYGRVFDGIFQTGDNITASAQPTAKPGDVRYKDINGDNQINDVDRAVIGNSNPKFFGGFNNTFTYKNFDLNVFVQGSYGNDILNLSRFDLFSLNGGNNNSAEVLNRWTPTNPSNTIPRANLLSGSRVLSSFQIEDGSYLRFKNVALGYRFGADLLKSAGIGSVRVYVSAQNLFTITNYTGFDPEVNRFGNGSISQGVDYGTYPSAKTFLAGLNLTF
ncbi:SusC/RagA family TonB-linked outer membrane protein [Mucilaginibacter terrae]|uniref:SusC/RagA family TonB-linked outer membrane protein n=1 Tax=Mucilaginibacter terrae TaxID=1955052 RepID=UPI0036264F8A